MGSRFWRFEMRSRSIGRAITDTSRRSWLSRFLTSCGGAVAVEFALIVSVFVMILFGIMTAGWVFYLQNNLETAARAGARHMAVWDALGAANKDLTCADDWAKDSKAACSGCVLQPTAENVACTWFAPIAPAAIKVHAVDCWADGDGNDLCSQPPNIECSVVVRVEVDGSQAAILDIFGFFGVTMGATVEMRREEEC